MTKLTKDDAKAVLKALQGMERANEYLGHDYYLSTDNDNRLRLWHRDGYSPGYVEMPDDFVMFVPDYRETP